jgi:predicted O-methyltransferase YrrM
MTDIETAVQRAIVAGSQIYNRKTNCPDDKRDAELRYLYQLAKQAPDGAAAELGVKGGGSFLCWSCARAGRGPLYAVDDWSTPSRDRFLSNIEHYDVAVEVYTGKSWEMAAEIAVSFAFVFIDANHREGIWKDIPAWTPKIVPGGIIAFHDYGVWKPTVDVKAAVDEWQSTAHWQLVGQVGSTIAFRRPL